MPGSATRYVWARPANGRTDNGYDFGALFNTPIEFRVAWDHSRIDGFTGSPEPRRAPRASAHVWWSTACRAAIHNVSAVVAPSLADNPALF